MNFNPTPEVTPEAAKSQSGLKTFLFKALFLALDTIKMVVLFFSVYLILVIIWLVSGAGL